MLIEPLWQEWMEHLGSLDLSVDLGTFLTDPIANLNFTFNAPAVIDAEREYLSERWLLHLTDGEPEVAIHHLYAMTRFSEVTGVDWSEPQSVLEWGGGYGGMARLAHKMNPDTTWTIIDLKPMLAIQKRYAPFAYGIPVDHAHGFRITDGIFVASCSLDESPPAAQDLAVETDWFGARHLLLAYQPRPMFTAADRFAQLVPEDTTREKAIVAGLTYAFR